MKKYANIICNQGQKPHLIIVTDGNWTQEIPVSNSSLTTCKKAIRQMHRGITIFVTEVVKSE